RPPLPTPASTSWVLSRDVNTLAIIETPRDGCQGTRERQKARGKRRKAKMRARAPCRAALTFAFCLLKFAFCLHPRLTSDSRGLRLAAAPRARDRNHAPLRTQDAARARVRRRGGGRRPRHRG